jgi:hypothetical protein
MNLRRRARCNLFRDTRAAAVERSGSKRGAISGSASRALKKIGTTAPSPVALGIAFLANSRHCHARVGENVDAQAIENWLNLAQTACMLTVALALIYMLHLLRVEIRKAVSSLTLMLRGQSELDKNVRRAWERIDAIEARERGLTPAQRDDSLERERPPRSSA